MDPARPPTSDLHGALVGLLLAATAAWLALTAAILDWAWDGALFGWALGRGGAVVAGSALAGVAAALVAAALGAIKHRRVRWSAAASLGAGQVAALGVAGLLGAYLAFGGHLADAPLPLTALGALAMGAATVAAVLLAPRAPDA